MMKNEQYLTARNGLSGSGSGKRNRGYKVSIEVLKGGKVNA
jgi:hypothetical protein